MNPKFCPVPVSPLYIYSRAIVWLQFGGKKKKDHEGDMYPPDMYPPEMMMGMPPPPPPEMMMMGAPPFMPPPPMMPPPN